MATFNADNAILPIRVRLRFSCKKTGNTVGGLWGRTVYDWLFSDYLVMLESMRGGDLGTQRMASAEAKATDRGCGGSWLTTSPFQARGCYENLGRSMFGTIDDSPAENVRIAMRKRFGQ